MNGSQLYRGWAMKPLSQVAAAPGQVAFVRAHMHACSLFVPTLSRLCWFPLCLSTTQAWCDCTVSQPKCVSRTWHHKDTRLTDWQKKHYPPAQCVHAQKLILLCLVERLTLHPLLLVMTLASQQRAESAAKGDTPGSLSPQRVTAIIKLSAALLQRHSHKNNKWCELQRCTFPQLEMWWWK